MMVFTANDENGNAMPSVTGESVGAKCEMEECKGRFNLIHLIIIQCSRAQYLASWQFLSVKFALQGCA